MNEFSITAKPLNEMSDLVTTYCNSLTGVVDDFWEEHIYNGTAYQICTDNQEIGFFTLYQEGGKMFLTSFYLINSHIVDGQRIMSQIIKEYQVQKAYVATCDELFLSLALELNQKVEIQAYFFDGTVQHPVRAAQFGMECMKKVSYEELPEIRKMTGDFYDNESGEDFLAGKFELYRIVSENETMGVGIMVPNKLKKGYVACGEIVLEQHRRKGVARSLQLNMAQMVRDRGLTPIGGCWYHNTLSKRTFDSCGRYTTTRLLNITF